MINTWTQFHHCASSFASLWSVRHNLGLSVLFIVRLLGHGGCRRRGFNAALSLLDVLLRVEDDDIDFGDVEHAQGYGGTQAHGHCQGGGLDKHLEKKQDRWERSLHTHTHLWFQVLRKLIDFCTHTSGYHSWSIHVLSIIHIITQDKTVYGISLVVTMHSLQFSFQSTRGCVFPLMNDLWPGICSEERRLYLWVLTPAACHCSSSIANPKVIMRSDLSWDLPLINYKLIIQRDCTCHE